MDAPEPPPSHQAGAGRHRAARSFQGRVSGMPGVRAGAGRPLFARYRHRWKNRYQSGGLEALADRSKRPKSSRGGSAPRWRRQCELRRAHPRWVPRRIRPSWQAHRVHERHLEAAASVVDLPDLPDPGPVRLLTVRPRRRKRGEYKRGSGTRDIAAGTGSARRRHQSGLSEVLPALGLLPSSHRGAESDMGLTARRGVKLSGVVGARTAPPLPKRGVHRFCRDQEGRIKRSRPCIPPAASPSSVRRAAGGRRRPNAK